MSRGPAIANGTRIGPYEVVGWIGAGGMGEVYRARDARLDRDVAIKRIPDSIATDVRRLQRFEQEARAVGQLSHPNVLALYDIGRHEGAPYIVSELLLGESLGHRLREGPLPWLKAVDLAGQTAAGLAAAHDRGIVHRDVKPENLFVTSDGRIKILDFGIAKLTRPNDEEGGHHEAMTETDAGTVIGTAGYMSPEQLRGEPVDARSDIFAVGSILYEMLTGRPAFVRETPADTVAAILKEEPQGPLPDAVPAALVTILSRCLEKTREQRFQSARDLAFGLEVLTGTDVRAPYSRNSARRPSMASLVIAAVGLVVAAAGWLTRGAAPADDAEPAGERAVHPLHELGGGRGGGRDLARWEMRRLSLRSRGRVRSLGQPGAVPATSPISPLTCRRSRPAAPSCGSSGSPRTGRRSGSMPRPANRSC